MAFYFRNDSKTRVAEDRIKSKRILYEIENGNRHLKLSSIDLQLYQE